MDLRSEEVRFFPALEVIPDPYNGLQSLCRPLGEVLKTLIIFIAFHRVKPGELLNRRWAHSLLSKQAKKSAHMGPTIGRYLEDNKAEIPKNLDEERVQRKPHSELKVALGQCHMTGQRNMRPFQISRLNHHETVLLRYLCTFLPCNRRFEVTTANRCLLFYVVQAT